MKLIFATNNQHKIDEIRPKVSDSFELLTLKEAGITVDIPEPYDTLEANATAKSRTIHEMTGLSCFSEDTGLEVDALGGEPGVRSARYAGEDRSFDANIDKLLDRLKSSGQRSARFRTVISLIWGGRETQFEGVCEGRITSERKGSNGFGYDPVFIPEGSERTFAEMSTMEKERVSHRGKATGKLVAFLNRIEPKQ